MTGGSGATDSRTADSRTAGTSRGADPSVVGPYLADALAESGWQDCSVELIAGGKSNLTYLVRGAAGEVILRRPPLGHVLPTAHDMVREHRVISALGGTDVPVPEALHLCTDPQVIGAPFYVMSRVPGPVVRDQLPAGYADTAEDRAEVAAGLIDTLVDLHEVDPAAVGLGDFGRPDGYLRRQLRRWVSQWQASDPVDVPALDALARRLAQTLPISGPGTIVHGDFRLDNCVLVPDRPGRVAAVLDWEMSTLGDPLADLGLLLVYWQQAGDPVTTRVVPSVTALPGFPTRAQVAECYAGRSGRDVTRLPWYVAFGCFKLAVVVTGIVARARAGAMVGDGFAGIGDAVAPLAERGLSTLATGAVG